MKKMIVVSMVASAVAVANAAESVRFYTNAVAKANACVTKGSLDGFNAHSVPTNEISAVDNILSGANLFWLRTPSSFPKTHALCKAWQSANFPGWVRYQYECDTNGNRSARGNAYILCNRIDGLIKFNATTKHLDEYKRYAIRHASAGVKKQLRKERKSFVTKDGVNPVQLRMDAVTSALDAPRFAGLKEALAGVGIDLYANPNAGIQTAAEIETLKNNIMSGEEDFTDKNKAILSAALGVAGYNAFVKEYNGEE